MTDGTPTPKIERTRRLALVGAGAVGSEVARLLAEAGFEDVLVVDPDRLERRNLRTSLLYLEAERKQPMCGLAKADIVRDFAREVHGLRWRSFTCEIADVGLGDLRDRELIVSCTDSAVARIETAMAARTLGLPMVDGAVRSHGVPEARATWFAASSSAACYLCGFSVARRAELLGYALSESLGCVAPPEADAMSGTSLATAVVARLLVQMLGAAEPGPDRSFAQVLDVRTEPAVRELLQLSRSAACPWHPLPAAEQMMTIDRGETLRDALKRVCGNNPDGVLELGWPVCLRARCRACGAECEPRLRTARLRRRGVCTACGSTGTLDPLACLGTIRAEDREACRTAEDLGLPANQMYFVRKQLRLRIESDARIRSREASDEAYV